MKKVLVFVSAVIFLTSCASCNKVDKQNINKSNLKKVYNPSDNQRLSPGTVSIKATVLENSKNNDSFILQVDKVLAYGHSTPELVKGEKINVSVKNEALKKRMASNTSLEVKLKSSVQKVNEKLSKSWKLINIK